MNGRLCGGLSFVSRSERFLKYVESELSKAISGGNYAVMLAFVNQFKGEGFHPDLLVRIENYAPKRSLRATSFTDLDKREYASDSEVGEVVDHMTVPRSFSPQLIGILNSPRIDTRGVGHRMNEWYPFRRKRRAVSA